MSARSVGFYNSASLTKKEPRGPSRGPFVVRSASELVVSVAAAVVALADVNVADPLRGGTCTGAADRVAHELDKAFGVFITHKADVRAVPFELGGGLRVQGIGVLELRASLEFARWRLHGLVEGPHPRLVLGDAGRILPG